MNVVRKYPVIYEINTWVWLGELSRRHQRLVTLATVPDQEWNALAPQGVDAVWFMGVWERSPAGIAISMQNEALLADFRRALPDFSPKDNVGSPYCVRRYVVDQHLGGPAGLAVARKMLADRGLRLILDFVPNHVAMDHPWITKHPDYFIQGSSEDLAQKPDEFFQAGGKVLALGRDPFFAPWPDVIQLNAFHSGLRKAIIETLESIAGQCDGMRCDMAMLLMTPIFERTWGHRAGLRPGKEYWSEVIQEVRKRFPDVLFIAEAYWDKEWELQQQGFDFCYDKRLYDRLEQDQGERVRLHLCADLPYQEKLVRFIENHDEPRAAAVFDPAKHRAAAVTALTLPGARLIHEGQMDGRRVRVPVFLGRRPQESPDQELRAFYQRLLAAFDRGTFLQGTWRLCERVGWLDNHSHLNLVCWCWQSEQACALIVVNLSSVPSQGLVCVPLEQLRGQSWKLTDVFTSVTYERHGDEMFNSGLYVDLPPWGYHFFTWS